MGEREYVHNDTGMGGANVIRGETILLISHGLSVPVDVLVFPYRLSIYVTLGNNINIQYFFHFAYHNFGSLAGFDKYCCAAAIPTVCQSDCPTSA